MKRKYTGSEIIADYNIYDIAVDGNLNVLSRNEASALKLR